VGFGLLSSSLPLPPSTPLCLIPPPPLLPSAQTSPPPLALSPPSPFRSTQTLLAIAGSPSTTTAPTTTMIMVHKPAQLPAPPSFVHRRAPSAPALAVQPTKTPGLLSLSKPSVPAKSQRQQRSPKPKPAQAATQQQQRSPKLAPAQAQPVPAASGSPVPRGRQNHGKDNKSRRLESF
jgi:hypothetical protein